MPERHHPTFDEIMRRDDARTKDQELPIHIREDIDRIEHLRVISDITSAKTFDFSIEPERSDAELQQEIDRAILALLYRSDRSAIVLKLSQELAGEARLEVDQRMHLFRLFVERYMHMRRKNLPKSENPIKRSILYSPTPVDGFEAGDVQRTIEIMRDNTERESGYHRGMMERMYERQRFARAVERFLRETETMVERPYAEDVVEAQERLWQHIRELPDSSQRQDSVSEVMKKMDVSVVLSHLDGLQLSDEGRSALLLEAVECDTEVVATLFAQLHLEETSAASVIVRRIEERRPDLFLALREVWGLTRAEEKQTIARIAVRSPEHILRSLEFLKSERVWSKTDLTQWKEVAEEALMRIERDPSLTPDEVLNRTARVPALSGDREEHVQRMRERALHTCTARASSVFDNDEVFYPSKEWMQQETEKMRAALFSIEDDGDRYAITMLSRIERGVSAALNLGRLIHIWKDSDPTLFQRLGPRNRVSILRSFLKTVPADMMDLDDIEHLLVPTTDETERVFQLQQVDECIASGNGSQAIVIIKRCRFEPSLQEALIDRVFQGPTDSELGSYNISYLASLLTSSQLERFLQEKLKISPYFLDEEYKDIVWSDAKQERAFLQQLIDGGQRPFSLFQSVDEVRLFLRHACFAFFWEADKYPEEEVLEKIQMFLAWKREQPDAVWRAFVQLQGYGAPTVLRTMTRENLDACALLIVHHRELWNRLRTEQYQPVLSRLRPENIDQCASVLREFDGVVAEETKRVMLKKRERGGKRKGMYAPDNPEDRSATKKHFENTYRPALFLALERPESIREIRDRYLAVFPQEHSQSDPAYVDFEALTNFSNLRRVYDFLLRFGPAVSTFLREHVVGGSKYDIMRAILEHERPKQRFEFFQKYADQLDFGGSEAERLAAITKELLLTKGQWMVEGVRVYESDGTERRLDALSTDEMHGVVTRRLEEVFTYDRSRKEATSLRNRSFAEQFTNKPLSLPHGTLMHASSVESAEYVLSQGNLCGECIGLASRADSYPFFVDSIRVSEDWESTAVADILRSKEKRYGGETIYLYPFRGDQSAFHHGEDVAAPGSGYLNHTLSFVGLPSMEIGAIVLDARKEGKDEKEDDGVIEERLESVRAQCVLNDLYVPLFDDRGKLLFTFDEFMERWDREKPYDSLEMFLLDVSYLAELDIPQGAVVHEFTLREHLLRAERYAEELAHGAGLSEEMMRLIRVAARLHDLGKEAAPNQPQEIANVEAAQELLQQVRFLAPEQRRRILMLIRHDELLGEVLQGTEVSEDGKPEMNEEAKKKFERFHEIFRDPEMNKALRILYRADILAIGNNMYEQWEIDKKFKALGLL